MLKLFGLRNCTTCQKAMAWLDQQNVAYSFVDVREDGVGEAKVAQWSKAVGGYEKLINRAGLTWRGLRPSDIADLNEQKAVALAAKNPSLIRRPLIEHQNGVVTTGFSDKVKALIG